MKRFFNWQVILGLSLITLSAVVYFIHYAIFKDAHHIFVYLLGDIAFVPIEVLLVTLIIHRLLTDREKRSILQKMNMVIGAFFSEAGTDLLKMFSRHDPQAEKIRANLIITNTWGEKDFNKAVKELMKYNYLIESRKIDLHSLKVFLISKRGFLLGLLQNPNLLEHESFTELLWAVFHLTEELGHRTDIEKLPDTDYAHLAGDIKRSYSLLIIEWLSYMRHLNDNYPYLFSLAMRTNPFNPNASAEVR